MLVGRAIPALMAISTMGALARAQPLTSDGANAVGAEEHFERGFGLAQQGDYTEAAREFAEAQRLKPNALVLFNLAQAYAASGQPIAALDAFEEYLRTSESGGAKDEERNSLVRRQIEIARAQIGQLELEIPVDGAEIEIDGRRIGVSPLLDPVRLTAGHHALVVRAHGHETRVLNVVLQPREQSRVSVQLEPLPAPSQAGFVVVACDVPNLEVSIDERAVGRTPIDAPLAIAPGEHLVSLRRAGYVPQLAKLVVASGSTAKVSCLGRVDSRLTSAEGGILAVAAAQFSGARIYVDGRATLGQPALVPTGKHRVRVTAPRYEPWTRDIEISAGSRVSLSPALVATEDYWRESVARRDRQRLWSQVTLGTGLAFLATAVTLSMITSEQRDDWAKERDRLNGLLVTDPGVAERMRASNQEALQIQRLGDLMLTSTALASGALGLSACLWMTTDELPASAARDAKLPNAGSPALSSGLGASTMFRYVQRF